MGTYAPTSDDGAVARLPIGGEGEAKGLLATIRLLSRARSQDEIMAVVSRAVRTLLGADGATFVLREGDRCYYAEEDAISPLWKGRRFPMSACISGWCMSNNRAVAIPDIQRDPRIPAEAYRPTFVRSLAMAPVGLDEPVAALGAYWSEARQPDAAQVECLQAIADAAALATSNVQGALPGDRRGAAQPAPSRTIGEPKRSIASERSWLRRFIDAVRYNRLQPNSAEAIAFAAACVVIATVLRLAVTTSGVHGLVIYSTYYPAALLATLIGGRSAGILAAALGGVAAHWLFAPQLRHFAPFTVSDAMNLALYGGACTLIILIIDWYQRTVLRLQQEDARHLTLACEQRHRVRNAIAVVEAIVQLSLRDEPERAKLVNRRIRAGLAEIDIRGEAGPKQPVGLRDLLTVELQPYGLERFALQGEDEPSLPHEVGGVLALAVHELTTNALKYGALSVPDGRVKVDWRVLDGRLVIGWREAGGPLVQPPQKRGYGSIMLRRLIEAVGGGLIVEFLPAGVTAEITLALEPDGGDRRAEAGGRDLSASASDLE